MAENEQNTAPAEATENTAPVVDAAAEAVAAEQQAQAAAEESLPAEEVKKQDLRPGMTVRVHQKISEGDKDRIQIFQGMIIAMSGKTPESKTITVQKQSFGVWVDKIFPVASPLIEKIEVVKMAKVRHAKLNFVQSFGRRLKETFVKN
ncbi:MAG: 50S ribosomal protein L19 [Candidatus Kerfeldbacteria bacterium]|nr:50S ribosomal protein L19 [Candidatus Kerfeldbacteria bacterium]